MGTVPVLLLVSALLVIVGKAERHVGLVLKHFTALACCTNDCT